MAEKSWTGGRRLQLPPQASLSPLPQLRCSLNSNDCVSLANIVESVNIPIDEEQAWAICYQCAKCVMDLREDRKPKVIYLVTDMGQVYLSRDGTVHPSTFIQPTINQDGGREKASSEGRLVENLGAVIYQALDFSVDPEEERRLSAPLAALINQMTASLDLSTSSSSSSSSSAASAAHGHEADEGIEEDGGGPELDLDAGSHRSSNYFTLKQVLESCSSHLSSPGQSEAHYKAVCRALVTEALELSTFLDKISQGTQELRRHVAVKEMAEELENLNIRDWARLWVQVIDELRRGVKLKKVEVEQLHPHPIEYALTPYEILMDDIRSRRYKLNKVMVNGDIPPRVKKDAHAIILEFIRSRPPLTPVSQRRIRQAAPEPPSSHESLMRSIRSKTHRLRPVFLGVQLSMSADGGSRSKGSSEVGGGDQSTRRLIKADTKLFNINNFDEDDDPLPSPMTPDVTCNGFSRANDSASALNFSTPSQQPLSPNWQKTVTLDLTKHSQVLKPERRHSITLCEVTPSPMDDSLPPTSLPPQLPSSTASATVSTSRPTRLSRSVSTKSPPKRPFRCRDNSKERCMSQDEVKHMLWKNSLECLSLTLEEVVHIRNVLTKAELENLLAGTHEYEDVAKGKLCFICKKTRFAFFGPWKQSCRLCMRTVCDKCCSKMRIPTEHFANIPVYTLSPSPSSSGDEDSPTSKISPWTVSGVNHSQLITTNAGSAPSTPLSTPRHPHNISSSPLSPICGTPVTNPNEKVTIDAAQTRKALLSRSKTIQRDDVVRQEKLRGSLMTVCKECKAMVCHVIVASRNSLALKQRTSRNASTFPWRIRSGASIPTTIAATSRDSIDTSRNSSRDSITSQFRLNLAPFYSHNGQHS